MLRFLPEKTMLVLLTACALLSISAGVKNLVECGMFYRHYCLFLSRTIISCASSGLCRVGVHSVSRDSLLGLCIGRIRVGKKGSRIEYIAHFCITVTPSTRNRNCAIASVCEILNPLFARLSIVLRHGRTPRHRSTIGPEVPGQHSQ